MSEKKLLPQKDTNTASKNIDTLHLNALRHLFQTSMDNLGQPE